MRLKALVDRINPPWASDHFCWTGTAHATLHDLLPLPLTREAIELVSDRVKKNKPALDPRTIIELVDTRMGERTGSAAQEVVASQELKSALDARFRSMLAHLENDVIPRVLKKYASGL